MEGPEQITRFGGKGGKFKLISDLDDKTNFVFSRRRQKNLASTERAEVKHRDEALQCTLHFTLILEFFLLISDVRNVLNKCTAEKPCEVNAGDCTFDNECRGNLICTRNNCKGSTVSLYANCCQEPGGDIFYISIWFGNHYKMVDIFFIHSYYQKYSRLLYFCLLYIFPKKNS